MSETLQITPGQFSLDQLRAIHQRQPALQLDAACRANIENSARTVSQIIADQRTVYGINTGFGLLARTSIPEDSLVTLQRNLILSHCTGTGPLLDDASVALIMALKIGSLARGFSGVGMAVTTDVGDLLDIHPRDKATVGNRLALAALAKTYNQKVVGSGPTYKSQAIDGAKITVTFENVGSGLTAKYQTLNGFTICGEDGYFYPARASIVGNDKIVVTADKVTKPIAVRFAWKNFPVANVYNKEGLPVVPFRTDDFPWTTGPKK